ncbi:unnamed protein product, partial [Ixodes persulcatus]
MTGRVPLRGEGGMPTLRLSMPPDARGREPGEEGGSAHRDDEDDEAVEQSDTSTASVRSPLQGASVFATRGASGGLSGTWARQTPCEQHAPRRQRPPTSSILWLKTTSVAAGGGGAAVVSRGGTWWEAIITRGSGRDTGIGGSSRGPSGTAASSVVDSSQSTRLSSSSRGVGGSSSSSGGGPGGLCSGGTSTCARHPFLTRWKGAAKGAARQGAWKESRVAAASPVAGDRPPVMESRDSRDSRTSRRFFRGVTRSASSPPRKGPQGSSQRGTSRQHPPPVGGGEADWPLSSPATGGLPGHAPSRPPSSVTSSLDSNMACRSHRW